MKSHLLQPTVSSDICTIIANFLAADDCFGTLANLNRIDRLTRDATEPILYETFFWDKVADEVLLLDFLKSKNAPKGLRFTKLVCFADTCLVNT